MKLNLLAPINSLGYGIIGLNTALGLARNGANPTLWPIGQIDVSDKHASAIGQMIGQQQCYDSKSPSLRCYHQFSLAEHVGKGPHCALPIFELDRFRANELHHLQSQDLVFAPSHWAGMLLVENGIPEERIAYAPFGVDRELFSQTQDLLASSTGPFVPLPTTFLNVGKWEYRKGHDILVEAFNKAFMPQDNVRLVMACFNPCFRTREQMDRYNRDWASLYKSSPLGEKIDVYQHRLPTQEDVARLMNYADCGVFPSRAEGWGLESAEMLAMGKHVILTDYSAHTEYADEESSLLVDIDKLEDASDGIWFDAFHTGWEGKPGRWAHLGPDQVDQLVTHMRSIHKSKEEGSLGVNYAGIRAMQRFTWDNTATEILSVLEVV